MTNRQAEDEAIGWVIRLRDAGEEEWAQFTAWLEADPANARAYGEAALADAEAETLVPPAQPQTRTAPFRAAPTGGFGRRAFFGWSLAASLLLIVGYAGFAGRAPEREVYETAAGETRAVMLVDGSRIDLNGGTRVVIDEKRPRFARLERGEALFSVVHDGARPFEVQAGNSLIRDLGTVFDVVRDAHATEVSVAEGAIVFNPAREARSLTPGMALREEGGRIALARVDTSTIGAWRQGRLVYSGATLAEVAADLSRSTGLSVRAAPDVAKRPFSGVIMLSGERRAVLQRAAALLGVGLRQSKEGWTFTRASATR